MTVKLVGLRQRYVAHSLVTRLNAARAARR